MSASIFVWLVAASWYRSVSKMDGVLVHPRRPLRQRQPVAWPTERGLLLCDVGLNLPT
jgi:hypothetical protein